MLMNSLKKRGIKLIVCDMAGTIVQENGAVYRAIAKSLRFVNCKIDDESIQKWPGRSKEEVIIEELSKNYTPIVAHDKYSEAMDFFKKELENEYFNKKNIELMNPNIPTLFRNIRNQGIKIGLNTGYSKDIQNKIMNYLNLYDHVDAYISSEDVKRGRPYPHMIHRLMEKCDIKDVKSVAKIGDTIIDMEEGINAGCSLNVGVLTGAKNKKEFINSNKTNLILDKITDLSAFL